MSRMQALSFAGALPQAASLRQHASRPASHTAQLSQTRQQRWQAQCAAGGPPGAAPAAGGPPGAVGQRDYQVALITGVCFVLFT